MMQLDLLNWEPPRKADVVPFPLARNAYRLKLVADRLETKHGRAAEVYWKATVTRLSGDFRRAGVSEAMIEDELRRFFDAVQAELCRRAAVGQGRP